MLIAIRVLFVLLLIGLRAPVAALVLTVFGAATAFAGLGVMALLGTGRSTRTRSPSRSASMTGLALGVGFSLLIVDRFHAGAPADGPSRARRAGRRRRGRHHGPRRPLRRHRADRGADPRHGDRADGDPHVARHRRAAVLGARHRRRGRRHAGGARRSSAPRMDALALPGPALRGARLGLARRPRPLGHALGRRRRRRRHGGARSRSRSRPRSLEHRPAGRHHAARVLERAARTSSAVTAVMGPGWPTPYNVVVVSTRTPDHRAPRLLRDDRRDYQRRIAQRPAGGLGRRARRLRGHEPRPQGAARRARRTPRSCSRAARSELGRLGTRPRRRPAPARTQLQRRARQRRRGRRQAAGAGSGKRRRGRRQAPRRPRPGARRGAAQITAGLARRADRRATR